VLLDRESLNEEARDKLSNPLDYVLSLADAGLAEMRSLIFELRPDALAEEGLVAALDRQVKAFRARQKLDLEVEFCPEPDLPLEAKEALYRIAQEALNNVVKHAQATLVQVRLQDNDNTIVLEVQDDGIGFEPKRDYPGHLGLKSMQERISKSKGKLEIECYPGQGTVLRAFVPIAKPTH